ncbi:MAG: four helix bundle protein [Bacteroidota bacterium]|nr:four helix bundle protein [Bacteroidota bacterium]
MGNSKSYRDLEIYQLSHDLAIKVHKISMDLPKHELYEQGSQVRRSSKSIVANIVEGYGRKRYKSEFIRFLIFANSSCDETISHLNMINQLYFDNENLNKLIRNYEELGKRIYRFIEYVEMHWK